MLLELNSVSKSYGKRELLKDISLKVNRGETIAIVGPSGSGKTTLLNLIGTLDKPDSGDIILNEKQLHTLNANELAIIRNTQIGFVFQMHYLLPQCTVFENILIPTLALKKADKSLNYKALELLERVGLIAQKDQYPSELSGGECQRVAFVRALINNPQLILADEPTGSLDQTTANLLLDLLLELNREHNTALIVVTHSLEFANKMQKVYRLHNSNLIAQS